MYACVCVRSCFVTNEPHKRLCGQTKPIFNRTITENTNLNGYPIRFGVVRNSIFYLCISMRLLRAMCLCRKKYARRHDDDDVDCQRKSNVLYEIVLEVGKIDIHHLRWPTAFVHSLTLERGRTHARTHTPAHWGEGERLENDNRHALTPPFRTCTVALLLPRTPPQTKASSD